MFPGKLKKSCIFLCLLFYLIPCSLKAGTTGKIVGRVIDKDSGQPIAGANIQIEATTYGAASGLDGGFTIFNIPAGKYTVSVMMIGYQTMKKTNVIVKSDFTTTVNFAIRPKTLEMSEAIEVVAERPLITRDQTSSMAEFSGDEIRKLPVEDYSEVLSLQAGVTVGANNALHIRGGRSEEIAYVVDGVPITDKYSGLPAVAVENSAIQELSLISGAFNAEYGQALSGVVNIVTREGGDKWDFSGQAYSGDYLSRRSDIFMNIGDVNPAAIYDVQFNAGGPLPLGVKIFSSARWYHNEGWLYGRRDFNISDSTDLNSENPEDWFIRQTGDSAFVPMNAFKRFTLNTKLSYRLGAAKFSYSLLWNDANYQEYNHYFKYTPDGNYHQFQKGLSHSLHVNYSLSNHAFFNLYYGFKQNNYRYSVFDNPLDPRYVDPDRLKIPEYRFFTGGTAMAYFKRETQTHSATGNLTWQVNKTHLVKTGFEAEQHKLHLREFSIQAGRDRNGVEIRPFTPAIPPLSAIGSNEYTRHPLEAALYVQDKIELNSVVINAGLRFDYFNAHTSYPINPGDPQHSIKKAVSPKMQFSPRLGIAYPLTATGILHFSFGEFFQMPPYQYLYRNPQYEVAPGALQTTMGNADLKPQQTVIYELGLQQQFSRDVAVDFTLYVKDIRNLLGQEFFRLDNDVSSKYVRYANRDVAKVSGFSLFLEKRWRDFWAVTLNYTYQIARGNASDPNALFYDLLANPPRETEKNVVYLDWDQRHTLNGSILVGRPGRWHISLNGSYGSGLPYTPTYQNQRTAFENSDRKPQTLNFDLRANYDFTYGRLNISLFTLIQNVFDTLNEKYVFLDTGRAGYTLQGQFVGNTGLYSLQEFNKRPDFYSEPRKIMIGISIKNIMP